jgi:phosphopantothenoylcysteine decarboxylase/phosphopantothenate--cysteine ligase
MGPGEGAEFIRRINMDGVCIVVGVTGGIAAYKAAELVSRLKKESFTVHVVMTKNAREFVSPQTFATLSGNPVATDTFRRERPWDVEHVSLARQADLMVIAPATANIIGKLACGIADDMLSTTAITMKAPVLVAPAMNENMYGSPAVQENIKTLKARGYHFIGPEHGRLACGDEGPGRMSEVEEIHSMITDILGVRKTLSGKRILVTAGPTREAIDPVRYITNRSSGKMGYALAAEAMRRGADVSLISGPVALTPPIGVDMVNVYETQEMYEEAVKRYPACDAAIMAGAPADYRPETVAEQKIKKGPEAEGLMLKLRENADIAAELGRMKRLGQVLVVYAAETENLLDHARAKMLKKNADLTVANDVTVPGAGFDSDTNKVTILTQTETVSLPMMTKAEVASAILDRVERMLKEKESQNE